MYQSLEYIKSCGGTAIICSDCISICEVSKSEGMIVLSIVGDRVVYVRPHFMQIHGQDGIYHATITISEKILQLCKLKDIWEK